MLLWLFGIPGYAHNRAGISALSKVTVCRIVMLTDAFAVTGEPDREVN